MLVALHVTKRRLVESREASDLPGLELQGVVCPRECWQQNPASQGDRPSEPLGYFSTFFPLFLLRQGQAVLKFWMASLPQPPESKDSRCELCFEVRKSYWPVHGSGFYSFRHQPFSVGIKII